MTRKTTKIPKAKKLAPGKKAQPVKPLSRTPQPPDPCDV